jgi:hypothetical protein
VTGPDLDEFDEDEFVDEFGGDEPSEPWHNSTRAVVGASIAGVAVLGVIIAAILHLTRQDDSTNAPLEFVDPSFSATASTSATSTTAETITSTAPLSTTEINGPSGPPTTSGSSGTSTSGSESSSPPTVRPRQTDQNSPTSRDRRPRFNITRSFAPQPIG